MATPKDLRRRIKAIQAQGFLVIQGKRGHYKIFAPTKDGRKGKMIATLGSTPSDWRTWMNTISYLRRSGVKVEG